MQIFVVNLERRLDRLNAMEAQLTALGLLLRRVAAIDANDVREEWLAQHFRPGGPLGAIPKGDKCCSLSHRRAWSEFLATGEPYAAILEDDVVLDSAAARLLRHTGWIPRGVDIVKLEHFGPEGQRVLVGGDLPLTDGHSIAPILSRHTGAAAYILSRRTAEILMAQAYWTVPVDHLLFNPNVSPIAGELKPYQMLPAIARQAASTTSDIRPWRLEGRRPSLTYVKREIVRAYYECRLLPHQIAAFLAGKARLAKVANPRSRRFDRPVREDASLAPAQVA